MFAVWSEVNGQDGLIWYTADSNSHAIAKYTGTYGLYNIHTYQNLNGQMKGLNGLTIDVPKPSAKAKITKESSTTYKVTITDVSVYIDSIQVPTWTEKGGQDDTIWYTAECQSDGTFTKIFSVAEHNFESGKYNIHYYEISSVTNTLTGLGGTSFTSDYHLGDIAITAQMGATGIEITMPQDIAKVANVSHAVWTSLNGQDDIKWYQATKQFDGTYILTFSPKEHNFESGHYNIHIYGQSQVSYSLEALSSTSGVDLSTDKYVVDPAVSVQNHDANNGTLKVRIAESAYTKKIKSVSVAVWSESDQSNLHWYTTSDVYDGVVTVMVNEKNHGYIKGNYTVHVYVDFTDNTTSGFNLGQYALNADEPAQHAPSYFIDISSHNGVISVSDYQRLKSQGITGVVVKLTEGTSYTNPYARAQIANAQAAGLRVSAYHYSHYETAAEARAEAQYFVRVAQSMGLSGSTTMVNDMEERSMLNGGLNANTQVWKDEMNHLGYSNNVYYTMASWLDTKGGKLNTAKFSLSNLQVAHYLYAYTYLDQESAKSLSYYSNTAAWQYTSVSPKLLHALDESIDYTGRFTW